MRKSSKEDPTESLMRQRGAIRAWAGDREKLAEEVWEPGVSGKKHWRERALGQAIAACERGEASGIVVEEQSRLQRATLLETAEVWEALQKIGARLVCVAQGIDTANGDQEFSFGVQALLSREQWKQYKRRSDSVKEHAIARGLPPFPKIPPGYRRKIVGRKPDGKPVYEGPLLVDPKTAPVMQEAFQMRADGAKITEVREFLREKGLKRTYHSVHELLHSPVYVGELHFGELVNTKAWGPIIDRATWRKVQRMKVPSGRRAKSERLLARLGVLRCGSCGSRLVVGSSDRGGHRYYAYQCPPINECFRRVSISAPLVEQQMVDAVKDLLAEERGQAKDDDRMEELRHQVEARERELDAAVEAFSVLGELASVKRKLAELQEAVDEATDRLNEEEAARPAMTLTISAAEQWDELTRDAQRALIKAVFESVHVKPGRPGHRDEDRLVITERT
jgi:DNA invertase Pin-like site-specific DNA recombinase